jgi:hypothetical protein
LIVVERNAAVKTQTIVEGAVFIQE